jgi:hypothetical protein
VREVSVLQLNFSICSERSEGSAAILIFRPTTSFSTDVLDFRPSIAILQRDLFVLPPDRLILRWTSQCSGSAFDDPLEI